MSDDRTKAARELLAFYSEAGVDAAVAETPIDRFADDAPEVSPKGRTLPRRRQHPLLSRH